ncbi:hypothetical protein [Nonomuraea cavernae]|nr:hypothetical protein [Nonomuraea cavernae]
MTAELAGTPGGGRPPRSLAGRSPSAGRAITEQVAAFNSLET